MNVHPRTPPPARANLSADTKDALARDLPPEDDGRGALRAGLLYYGAVPGPDGAAIFRTRRAAVARLARTLFEEASAVGGVRRSQDKRLYRSTTFEIDVPASALAAPARPKRRIDRRLELRAAFLCCGSLANPATGYHLEFVPVDPPHAERIGWLVHTEGAQSRVMQRKGRPVVYLKGLDDIVTVLGAIGAHAAVLHLEDVRAVKETKNRVHRLVNTEAANVVRAAEAAAAQAEAIAYLADAYGLRNLSPALREAAQLRLAHPDETLSELGARCRPPVGKATINGRIATLLRLAERLRAGRGMTGPRL